MYLSSTLSITLGLPLINAVLQTTLQQSLVKRLVALGLGAGDVAKVCGLCPNNSARV
jgi:hypothetical protein